MREHQLSPIAPTSLVSYANIQNIQQDILIAEKQQIENLTQEEIIYYITHKVNNKKHDNGRIYMSLNKEGLLYANSVSPYSDTFEDNIEDGVKDLVRSLREKRYLTYSSCEGHDFTFRRYVGLAFCDIESRDYIANYIKKLNIIGVEIRFSDSVTNQKIEFSTSKKVNYVEKYKTEEVLNENIISEEAKSFNIQFHRHYERFYFMEIVILKEFDPQKENFGIKSLLKFTYLFLMKKFLWNYLTKKVTEAINSKDFKKYPY